MLQVALMSRLKPIYYCNELWVTCGTMVNSTVGEKQNRDSRLIPIGLYLPDVPCWKWWCGAVGFELLQCQLIAFLRMHSFFPVMFATVWRVAYSFFSSIYDWLLFIGCSSRSRSYSTLRNMKPEYFPKSVFFRLHKQYICNERCGIGCIAHFMSAKV